MKDWDTRYLALDRNTQGDEIIALNTEIEGLRTNGRRRDPGGRTRQVVRVGSGSARLETLPPQRERSELVRDHALGPLDGTNETVQTRVSAMAQCRRRHAACSANRGPLKCLTVVLCAATPCIGNPKMKTFLARRITYSIVLLLATTIFVFVMSRRPATRATCSSANRAHKRSGRLGASNLALINRLGSSTSSG